MLRAAFTSRLKVQWQTLLLGPPIKTVLRILVLAVVADLGRAVLVHDDNAPVTRQIVADLGHRRWRQTLDAGRVDAVAKGSDLRQVNHATFQTYLGSVLAQDVVRDLGQRLLLLDVTGETLAAPPVVCVMRSQLCPMPQPLEHVISENVDAGRLERRTRERH